MSITITDPNLLDKLIAKRGLVELQDADGELVGRVQTTWPTPLPRSHRDCFLEHVADLALLAAFARVKQPVLLFDPNGELLGLFERDWYGMPLSASRIREIEERRRTARKEKGHTLAEVWQIIYEKYVGDDVEPFIVADDNSVQ